jgi:hypothetical protein
MTKACNLLIKELARVFFKVPHRNSRHELNDLRPAGSHRGEWLRTFRALRTSSLQAVQEDTRVAASVSGRTAEIPVAAATYPPHVFLG